MQSWVHSGQQWTQLPGYVICLFLAQSRFFVLDFCMAFESKAAEPVLAACAISFFMSADNNECATNNGGCQQICTNFGGSYICACKAGYSLNADQRSCRGM